MPQRTPRVSLEGTSETFESLRQALPLLKSPKWRLVTRLLGLGLLAVRDGMADLEAGRVVEDDALSEHLDQALSPLVPE